MTGPPERRAAGAGVSPGAATARQADPDRFLCALFLPQAARDAAFTLIAFNHETVRALGGMQSRAVAGPMAGMIRLQWWREIVEGAGHPHAVADPLRALLAQGRVRAETLLAILDAREAELDGLADWPAWRKAMYDGAGGVQVAIAQAAGVTDPDLLRAVQLGGAAYGAGGLVRHLERVLAGGRCPVPDSALAGAGLSGDTIRDGATLPPDMLRNLRADLCREGAAFLAQAGQQRLPRPARAAALPGVLARRDLARGAGGAPAGAAPRGLGDRLAVMAAMAFG
ncbi:squalene/phytoene synthase family protein [Gluconacetobacter takamatsuzukensis]|uniref:Squalene/phytoene synthase family protein n=1 Tax=Gluconacetobacter takamatsuzukensis TaxID=1286190 RepID=A0A7W4PP01_9PROT|nr:squalene/phytoene synthase family protein [Gluconacetobacter takamatsuzukensis]MBB2204668.1 squalene/phytoene synthase family protein [Gluconacetobacter takamatsuzukensis]